MAQREEGRQELEEASAWGGGWSTCLAPPSGESGRSCFPAFQPCCSLKPRRDWPRARPEWKCTSEKDPAGDPGEGSLPSGPLLSHPTSQLCVWRGRGMLARPREDRGGGCICGLPGNKCTLKAGVRSLADPPPWEGMWVFPVMWGF